MRKPAKPEFETANSSVSWLPIHWATSTFAGLTLALIVGGSFGLRAAAFSGGGGGVASGARGGEQIANAGAQAGAPPCSGCHGQFGEGQAAGGIPGLAGIDRLYLERELEAFRNGVRRSLVMTPYAKALTPAQLHAVAQYYASLPRASDGSAVVAPNDRGRQLAHLGRLQQGLPSCETCHGARGEGDGPAPALAGQPRGYLEGELKVWRAGGRREGPDFFMSLVASKLSDRDIDELAVHYAALPAHEPAAASKPPAPGAGGAGNGANHD
jgi:cytochrome c553